MDQLGCRARILVQYRGFGLVEMPTIYRNLYDNTGTGFEYQTLVV